MHIRCPHCHNPIEVVDGTSLAEILCPSCGSSFSLIGDQATQAHYTGTRRVAHFELVRELGIGKFGSVWMARDTELDRTVAVKIPRKGALDPGESELFLRDARAAAQLKHPHIVGVHEVGREDGTVYIVSDYVEGANLKEWLSGQRLSFREAAELVVKVSEALEHAHRSGVVHRDLKPGNIMMDRDGQPHVIDFGLAKREAGEITMTVEGHILGTPAYMSPEQATGRGHDADARSDVYSLGVILFELLTGELPFRGETQMLLLQIQRDDPPRPRKLNAKVPRDLETITLKCLEKEPAKRYQTAQQLADDLKRWLAGHAIVARPVSRAARGWRWAKRNPLAATVLATLLVITIGSASYWWTRPAYLDVRVTPGLAQVRVGGKSVSVNEGRALVQTRPGRVVLEVAAEGYEPERREVLLVRGRENAVVANVELAASYGYAQVASEPAGASVELLRDGEIAVRGTTPFHSPRLPAGEYTVRVSKPLYHPLQVALQVPIGDRVNSLPAVTLKATGQGAESFEELLLLRERLQQPIARPWKFAKIPLRDALDFIAKSEDVSIVVERRRLQDVGLDETVPVTVQIGQQSLGEALTVLLDSIDAGADLSQFDGKLKLAVTTKDVLEAPSRLHRVSYYVGDIVTTPGSTTKDFDLLVDTITVTIRPTTWDEVGGPGSLSVLPAEGVVSVVQTWSTHFQIYDLLEDLRQARQLSEQRKRAQATRNEGAAVADQPPLQKSPTKSTTSFEELLLLRERMRQPIAKPWSFANMPLHQALDFIAESEDVSIVVDRRHLKRAGVDDETTPITFQLRQGSLGDALGMLLRTLDLGAIPSQFDGRFSMTVTTLDRLESFEELVRVSYYVDDIVTAPGSTTKDFDSLIDTITSTVRPQTWDQAGGPASLSVMPAEGVLSISQTWARHFEVYDLLEDLRRMRQRTDDAPSGTPANPPETAD